MDLIEKLIGFKTKFQERIAELQSTPVNDEKMPVYPNWYLSARLGQPRLNFNLPELRAFSKSEWVQMVQLSIKKAVQKTKWKIVLKDEESEEDIKIYDADVKKITDFLEVVNVNKDDINDIISGVLTDILEIDAGVINKLYSEDSYMPGKIEMLDTSGRIMEVQDKMVLKPFGQRQLLGLMDSDGGMFFKNVDIYKRMKGYYQYSFKHPAAAPRWFDNDELCYLMMNRRSDSIYGWSPVQSIQQVIEVLIQSTRYNKEFFKNNAIPDALMFVKNASSDSLKKFKTEWRKSFKGQAHKLGFMSGDGANLVQLSRNLKDMEWLEGQKWYYHLVFGIFGLSPEEAGFFENSNRSTSESQERVSLKNAIEPYLDLIERKINREIIPEILQKPDINVKFKFFTEDKQANKELFEQQMQELDHNVLTINEYRMLNGKDKVEWGDTPGSGADSNFGQDPFGGFEDGGRIVGPPKKNPKPDQFDDKDKGYRANFGIKQTAKKNLPITKSDDIIDAGEDIIDESEDYQSFFKNVITRWEKKVLNNINKIEVNKSFEYNKKTFGEFLFVLMNTINTKPFLKRIRVLITDVMKGGLESAEDELDMDIGFTVDHRKQAKIFENQQLNGYTIDGKRWAGIKGATKELQFKILKEVEAGIKEKKTLPEITKDIQEVFTSAKEGQAVRIARTESNRFSNQSKLISYKKSGIVKGKRWLAAIDSRTSPICKSLNGQIQPLDRNFIDPNTKKEYIHPPAHPSCRSIITAVIK